MAHLPASGDVGTDQGFVRSGRHLAGSQPDELSIEEKIAAFDPEFAKAETENGEPVGKAVAGNMEFQTMEEGIVDVPAPGVRPRPGGARLIPLMASA